MVKLPVKISLRHRGKFLGLDSEGETMTLLDPTGEPLGAVSVGSRHRFHPRLYQ